MTLTAIELPAPVAMRGRWAAIAAVCAARGWSGSCHADGPTWHFDDGGGNWAELHHVGDGRALLVGHDHEYSDTYDAEAASYFGEEETDLLAGAPPWWERPVRAAAGPEQWVGFGYGFDGATWRCATYDLNDGSTSVGLPALDQDRYRDLAAQFVDDAAPGLTGPPGVAALDGLAAADGGGTPALLPTMIGPSGWDAEAGAAATQRFRTG